MLLPSSIRVAKMTICLGKSCSFGLHCVSFVNVNQFVCVFSLLISRVGCGI